MITMTMILDAIYTVHVASRVLVLSYNESLKLN